MSFLGKLFMPKTKAVASNVNQKALTDAYLPVVQQGIGAGNWLNALITGQGNDYAPALEGYKAYQDQAGYEDALNRMSRAVVGGGAASGLLRSGSTQQALLREGAQINRNMFTDYLGLLGGVSDMGQNAGQLVGQAGQGQVVKKPSILSTIASPLGGVAAQLKGSDRRLKEDIKLVGEYPNGLPKYEFRYKGQNQKWTGVMADDVEKVFSQHVYVMPDGFKSVDYGALGIRMEAV